MQSIIYVRFAVKASTEKGSHCRGQEVDIGGRESIVVTGCIWETWQHTDRGWQPLERKKLMTQKRVGTI